MEANVISSYERNGSRAEGASDLEYRIVGWGIVMIPLRPDEGILAEPGCSTGAATWGGPSARPVSRADRPPGRCLSWRHGRCRVLTIAPATRPGRKGVLIRLTGAGVVFLQAHGSSTELELDEGEELEAPGAAVVCFEAATEYELRLTRGGGATLRRSGLEWMATLTGAGRVMLQTGLAASP